MTLLDDNEDRVVELLEALVEASGGTDPADVDVTEQYDVSEGGTETTINRGDTIINQGGTNSGTAVFSTGPNGIALEEAGTDEAREVELGFDAGTINIRTPAAVYVAFADPRTTPGRWIPISSEESPFTIGGSNPIGVDRFWMTQQDPNSTSAVGVDIIAYE